MPTPLQARIDAFITNSVQVGSDRIDPPVIPFWDALTATGTAGWLDTGDIDAAEERWCTAFSALTTK